MNGIFTAILADNEHSHRQKVLFFTAGLSVLFALFTANNFLNQALVWINLYWLVCAFGAFVISLLGISQSQPSTKKVRVALSSGLGIYCVGQVVWSIQVANDWSVVPGPSDVFFLIAPIPLIRASLSSFYTDVSSASARSVWLDGVTVALASVAITFALFGAQAGAFGRYEGTILLLYPMLYLVPIGTVLIALLAIPQKPSISGVWLIPLGALILGGSFITWTSRALADITVVGNFVDYIFGIGLITIGVGASTWRIERVTDKSVVEHANTLADALPVVAVIAAVALTLRVEMTGAMALLTWATTLSVICVAGMRQVLLLRSQRDAQVKLRTMANELSNTENDQRRSIATYLHDSVAQELAVLRIKFSLLRKHSKRPDVDATLLEEEIDEMLLHSIQNVRSTTMDISPPKILELGLSASVEKLATNFTQRHRIEITVIDDGLEKPLDAPVTALLYRFVSELLMNIVKHAKVSSAQVLIERLDRVISITISDEGVGFQPENTSKKYGFGLDSIRERCAAIGGRFVIESRANSGTRATIEVPVQF